MTQLTMAEAQAVGLCHLARRKGLPDIPLLRAAVSQMHPLSCGWCDYPRDELLAMLVSFRPMAREESQWWALPNKARRAAIEMAQGREAA